jgi:hypothetical protein
MTLTLGPVSTLRDPSPFQRTYKGNLLMVMSIFSNDLVTVVGSHAWVMLDGGCGRRRTGNRLAGRQLPCNLRIERDARDDADKSSTTSRQRRCWG